MTNRLHCAFLVVFFPGIAPLFCCACRSTVSISHSGCLRDKAAIHQANGRRLKVATESRSVSAAFFCGCAIFCFALGSSVDDNLARGPSDPHRSTVGSVEMLFRLFRLRFFLSKHWLVSISHRELFFIALFMDQRDGPSSVIKNKHHVSIKMLWLGYFFEDPIHFQSIDHEWCINSVNLMGKRVNQVKTQRKPLKPGETKENRNIFASKSAPLGTITTHHSKILSILVVGFFLHSMQGSACQKTSRINVDASIR